mgnify:CR=1 FL=1
MIIQRKKRQVLGLNTSSTADISFMLLIFFLVTTSMDVDKGLSRLLPSPEPQKEMQQESVVDKSTLMSLELTADNQLLLNDSAIQVKSLEPMVVRFVNRLGKRHLISIKSDRNANYDLYFQMQNQIKLAYDDVRNAYSQKHYGKDYASLSNSQKNVVLKACPQRVTESYANAASLEDKRNDASAEEQQKGGKK